MTCLLPQPYTTTNGRPRRNLAVSFMKNINSYWARFTSKATGATKKLKSNSPKSPLVKRPKQLSRQEKRMNGGFRNDDNDDDQTVEDLDFGNGGLWQRDILMGDKCQPLNFSGVIYYDRCGKRLTEVPMKSPRASPMPRYYYDTT